MRKASTYGGLLPPFSSTWFLRRGISTFANLEGATSNGMLSGPVMSVRGLLLAIFRPALGPGAIGPTENDHSLAPLSVWAMSFICWRLTASVLVWCRRNLILQSGAEHHLHLSFAGPGERTLSNASRRLERSSSANGRTTLLDDLLYPVLARQMRRAWRTNHRPRDGQRYQIRPAPRSPIWFIRGPAQAGCRCIFSVRPSPRLTPYIGWNIILITIAGDDRRGDQAAWRGHWSPVIVAGIIMAFITLVTKAPLCAEVALLARSSSAC